MSTAENSQMTIVSELFKEGSVFYAHKFTDEQLRATCIAEKCEVKMRAGNILSKLANIQRKRYGFKKTDILARGTLQVITTSAYERYQADFHEWNIYQTESIKAFKRLRKECWTIRRMILLNRFNINFLPLSLKFPIIHVPQFDGISSVDMENVAIYPKLFQAKYRSLYVATVNSKRNVQIRAKRGKRKMKNC